MNADDVQLTVDEAVALTAAHAKGAAEVGRVVRGMIAARTAEVHVYAGTGTGNGPWLVAPTATDARKTLAHDLAAALAMIGPGVRTWQELGTLLAPAVERMIAARTAEATAPTDAREALARVEALLDERDDLARDDVEEYESRHPGNKAGALVTTAEVRAALSPTAPDAGQRDTQERAEVDDDGPKFPAEIRAEVLREAADVLAKRGHRSAVTRLREMADREARP